MEVLRNKIQDNKVIILRDLDLRKEMLTYMSMSGLLEMQDCVQLQVIVIVTVFSREIMRCIWSAIRITKKSKYLTTKDQCLRFPRPLGMYVCM